MKLLILLLFSPLLWSQSTLNVSVNNTTNVLTIGTCSSTLPCWVVVNTGQSAGPKSLTSPGTATLGGTATSTLPMWVYLSPSTGTFQVSVPSTMTATCGSNTTCQISPIPSNGYPLAVIYGSAGSWIVQQITVGANIVAPIYQAFVVPASVSPTQGTGPIGPQGPPGPPGAAVTPATFSGVRQSLGLLAGTLTATVLANGVSTLSWSISSPFGASAIGPNQVGIFASINGVITPQPLAVSAPTNVATLSNLKVGTVLLLVDLSTYGPTTPLSPTYGQVLAEAQL